jgi:hypothetical protein
MYSCPNWEARAGTDRKVGKPCSAFQNAHYQPFVTGKSGLVVEFDGR